MMKPASVATKPNSPIDPDRPAGRPHSDFSDISDTFAFLIEFEAPPATRDGQKGQSI